jgi:N-methylhydantoinase B
MEEVLDHTERLTRAILRELPDGEWSFEDWIDDDGVDYGVVTRSPRAMKSRFQG